MGYLTTDVCIRLVTYQALQIATSLTFLYVKCLIYEVFSLPFKVPPLTFLYVKSLIYDVRVASRSQSVVTTTDVGLKLRFNRSENSATPL